MRLKIDNAVKIARGLRFSPVLSIGILFLQFLLTDALAGKSFKDDFFQSRSETLGVVVAAVADPEQVKPGKNFHVRLQVSIPEGWHIYSLRLEGEESALATTVRFLENVFPMLGAWEESQPRIEMDGVLQKAIKSHSRSAEFSVLQMVSENTQPGVYPISGMVVYHACDNKICTLPKELPFQTRIRVIG